MKKYRQNPSQEKETTEYFSLIANAVKKKILKGDFCRKGIELMTNTDNFSVGSEHLECKQ